jgi:hypothetical protein
MTRKKCPSSSASRSVTVYQTEELNGTVPARFISDWASTLYNYSTNTIQFNADPFQKTKKLDQVCITGVVSHHSKAIIQDYFFLAALTGN